MSFISQMFLHAIDEAIEADDTNFCVTLTCKKNSTLWMQFTGNSINFAYPFRTEPLKQLQDSGVSLPSEVELLDCKLGKFATFSHAADDPDALGAFATSYASRILGLTDHADVFDVEEELL